MDHMNKRVGIGFIGTGFARKVQMPAFAACENAELVSVSSGSAENAKTAAGEFGIRHFGSDWHETASHPDVDLLCITTPPSMHNEMVLFALAHHKNILAEKPMAMNLVEAEEMRASGAAAGVLCVIDHELRFLPGRQTAYEMIRQGVIGKVRHAKYNFRAPHRGDPSVPWNWWSDEKEGGGSLGAINSHIIDSFNWLLAAEISSVFCQLQTHIKTRKDPGGISRDVTSDDEANMILRFADGQFTEDATGIVSVSMTEAPEYVNVLELFGTKGSMKIGQRGELAISGPGIGEWKNVEVELGENIVGVPDTGFARGFAFFAPKIVEAVMERKVTVEHAATFEDGIKVQRVLDAARESNAKGMAVRLRSA